MLLVVGRPGVARGIEKKLKQCIEDCSDSLFFTKFPDLEDYNLAYDFRFPRVDLSDPEMMFPS